MNKSNPIVEILIFTNGSKTTEKKVTAHAKIVHRISHRLFVISIPYELSEAIQHIQGVVDTFEDQISAEVREKLDVDESTFIEAWEHRQSSGQKKRKGEGLDWDSKGFAPPDDPGEDSGNT